MCGYLPELEGRQQAAAGRRRRGTEALQEDASLPEGVAVEQGDEADEARRNLELRSLSPVLCRHLSARDVIGR